MANTSLTADILTRESLIILENELGVLGSFHRPMDEEFQKSVNGYKVGSTVSIRRPADFSVRTGAVMDVQDVVEGKVALTIDTQKGIDFEFTSEELTMDMDNLKERVIKPAMSSLVNNISSDALSNFYQYTYNWAGTAGQDINSFLDFIKGPERLSELAAPMQQRMAALGTTDYYAMVGAQVGLGASDKLVGDAWKSGMLTGLGGMEEIHMSQVVPVHTNGAAVDTSAVIDGSSQEVTYETAKDAWTQTLTTDGWGNSQSVTAGTVFTIASVYRVNPKTKVSTGKLQQFTITTATTTHASGGDTVLTISPPIITSGPHQTVTYSGDMDGNAITRVGAVSTAYTQNLCYHKNAYTLAFAPLEMPQGAVNGSRQTSNGISVRVIPVYDGINDVSKWRLDVLYGKKVIDPRIATRLSGTS